MFLNSYEESLEESGRIFRIVLNTISKYKLPYNPVTYAVWYDYASGNNPSLIKAVDSLIFQKGEEIIYQDITKLFLDHIAEKNSLLAEKKIDEFQRIIVEITRQIDQAGAQMDSQSNILTSYAVELKDAKNINIISEIANSIISETKNAIGSTISLKERFDSTLSEISTMKKELEGIYQEAKTDMLTGLLNRRGFEGAILEAVQQAMTIKDGFSIVILDIDHFKKVNDTYGHLIGDSVLKTLGRLIMDFIKGRDTASRYGGEEFILLLPDTHLDGAVALAEKMRGTLEKMNWKNKNTGKAIGAITISLGVSQYRPGDSVETLIQRADDALYHAKQTGRNKTVTDEQYLRSASF